MSCLCYVQTFTTPVTVRAVAGLTLKTFANALNPASKTFKPFPNVFKTLANAFKTLFNVSFSHPNTLIPAATDWQRVIYD